MQDGDDDARAFEESVRGAQAIPKGAGRIAAAAPPRRVTAPARERASLLDVGGPLTSNAFLLVVAGEQIEGRASGVDARAVKRLKGGEPAVEARVDLHGHSRDPALAALERFVRASRAASRRAVLVIHGRGARSSDEGPVLKPLVWRWLASSKVAAEGVLAFTSAGPAQGGDGATLVLLRKPR
jgi:DNA-nicking Smr family endonuclease